MTEKRPRILVVDDEDRNIRLLEAMLQPLEYEVVTARNGQEAIDRVRETSPDVILLDIMMPIMDGFETAKRLKEDEETRIIPIIMVTALEDVEDKVRALEAGADDFLSKPVDKVELSARIASSLKVKAYYDHLREYQNELEREVTRRTEQLRAAFERVKESEVQLRTSLREKETLRKEVHQRVKSNLQAISGLLDLQIHSSSDHGAERTLKESQQRIQTMALVHEGLYEASDLASIDFATYVEKLVYGLATTYSLDPETVSVKLMIKGIVLNMDTAIPCGLIVNEMVSNSLKHAFPDGREGEILVEMKNEDENRFSLVVSDNGIGLPDEVDFEEPGTMGMQLIKIISAQLGAELELKREGGTTYHMAFKEYHEVQSLDV